MRRSRNRWLGCSRRQLLKALGLAGASGFLPSLARAQRTAPPKRLLCFVTAHGTVWDQWAMRAPGAGLDKAWSYDLTTLSREEFSPLLAPLHRHRQHMLVLDGLSIANVGVPKLDPGPNEHERGHAAVLTGSSPRIVSGGLAQAHSASLDQLLAAEFDPDLDTGPLYPSLELGGQLWSEVSFDAQGKPLPRSNDLPATFDRLFGLTLRQTAPTSDGQTSVLDLVSDQYRALSERLGFDDRLKLDRHFSLVRDLERRLRFAGHVDCGELQHPGQGPTMDSVEFPGWRADGMLRLAALALSCDLTRVITWQEEGVDMNVLGFPGGDIHQEGAHAVHSSAKAREVMIAYHHWHTQRLALLLDQLANTPDGEGSLLDSTLVMWINELGDGAHAWDRLPVLLFGGGAGFRMGRYLHWPQEDMLDAHKPTPIGPPHNRLLLAIGQAFGLDAAAIGEPGFPRVGGGVIAADRVLDRLV